MTKPRLSLTSSSSLRRGYALPLVMGLVLLLSAALTTVIFGMQGSIAVGEALLHRRQAFHAAEGVSLAAMELAAQRLRTLPTKPNLPETDVGFVAAQKQLLHDNEEATSQFINDNKAEITPDGYVVGDIRVSGLGVPLMQRLENGPFAGMLAQVQPLSLDVAVTREHDRSPATQLVVASIQRATVSLFQFYVFSDVYLDLDPGGEVVTSGRIHTNQDFCVAGEPVIDTVTAAGRILMSNRDDQKCRRRATERNEIKIATDDTPSPATALLTKDHEASDWISYAQNTFHGHVLDSAHNVSPLKMPINGKPRVQAGANVLAQERISPLSDASLALPIADAKEDNTTTMRFLVDPILVTEPEDVRQQKFAFQADIRIIDGVWYLRDPADPAQIGDPIWSDHPGNATVANMYSGHRYGIDIVANPKGQEDIRVAKGWSSTPKRYSYYGFRPDGSGFALERTTASPRAVISYGLLKKTGVEDTLVPGAYSGTPVGGVRPTLVAADNAQKLLNGTRAGFKDGWIEVRSETTSDPTSGTGQTTEESERARMLPVNFDVLAFQDALQTCTSGELGTYFAGCGGTRTFNGIVYIGVTWPGSTDGFGDTAASSNFAKLWPFHGKGTSGPQLDDQLPMPLCVGQAGTTPFPITGQSVTLPRCPTLSRTSRANFPNIVRVFNAAHISSPNAYSYAGVNFPRDFMPKGLSIVSNVSVAASGHVNLDTTPKRRSFEVIPNDFFVPFLIGADRFHRHSIAWDDSGANWGQLMDENDRRAEDTVQSLEILAGWNPTPVAKPGGHDHSSDGFEDFPRYNETWGSIDKKATTFGSIVVGFASVYERTGANNGDGAPDGFTTSFPKREEGFDFHLEDPAKQPPGTPQLLAQSIGFWQAK